ncbi:hypothetical protein HPG69_009689 [Diceros bicornis minor]|uniref:Uncharacterized protein n=1 Tax=Diceros bicornis minor TaxID=77932 RepID=A0A7J7EXS1_DICBM|nr:hypothetical protein HPG69_009689 [Diceros bicornis minor]
MKKSYKHIERSSSLVTIMIKKTTSVFITSRLTLKKYLFMFKLNHEKFDNILTEECVLMEVGTEFTFEMVFMSVLGGEKAGWLFLISIFTNQKHGPLMIEVRSESPIFLTLFTEEEMENELKLWVFKVFSELKQFLRSTSLSDIISLSSLELLLLKSVPTSSTSFGILSLLIMFSLSGTVNERALSYARIHPINTIEKEQTLVWKRNVYGIIRTREMKIEKLHYPKLNELVRRLFKSLHTYLVTVRHEEKGVVLETMKNYDSCCYGRVACEVSEFQQYVLELIQKTQQYFKVENCGIMINGHWVLKEMKRREGRRGEERKVFPSVSYNNCKYEDR